MDNLDLDVVLFDTKNAQNVVFSFCNFSNCYFHQHLLFFYFLVKFKLNRYPFLLHIFSSKLATNLLLHEDNQPYIKISSPNVS